MIPQRIKNYIGIPFEPCGRTRLGIDCWGLVRMIYHEQFNIELPSFLGYEGIWNTPEMGGYTRSRMAGWYPIKPGLEKFGDVVLFRITGEPWHVGLVVGDGSMIHAVSGSDSCLEKYMSHRWAKRITGIYRYWKMQ